ncbi:glycosyltransferase [Microseira wollei]|uniref:glycosyltransferase n=1 Tax=Microseira wollei TaxID=467598 RepID=UPI001CFEECDF
MCDDASRDISLDIAKEYPIEILQNSSNIGVGTTRQPLVNRAKYYGFKFVQLLDADDYLWRHKIESQLEVSIWADIIIERLLQVFPNSKIRVINFDHSLLNAAK